jgi:SAM-dependent methyltransferase
MKSSPPSLESVYRTHHASHRRPDFAVLEDERARLMLQWLGGVEQLCDLGCRDGQLARHYVGPVKRVVGCEIDPEAAQRASERGLEVHRLDLNQPLPFATGEFDALTACEVLEHLPYWGISVAEAVRVVKPQGLILGSIPLAYHLTDRWRVLRGKTLLSAKDPTHVKFYSLDTFVDTMQGFGLRLEAIEVLEGGGTLRSRWPRLFARNVAFRFRKSA